jgi:hypothetical protein
MSASQMSSSTSRCVSSILAALAVENSIFKSDEIPPCSTSLSQSSHLTTSSQPNRFSHPIRLPAIMQVPTIFLIAATIASAAAAPTGGSSAKSGSPIKCQHEGGKWKPGWEGAPDKDKYICNTSGLVVSNSLSVDEVLKLMGSHLEHPGLRQHPRRRLC